MCWVVSNANEYKLSIIIYKGNDLSAYFYCSNSRLIMEKSLTNNNVHCKLLDGNFKLFNMTADQNLIQ